MSLLVEVSTEEESLYCSKLCVSKDGMAAKPHREITQEEYEERRSEWGACCPVCDGEYPEF